LDDWHPEGLKWDLLCLWAYTVTYKL
jgi:hypothetical protein